LNATKEGGAVLPDGALYKHAVADKLGVCLFAEYRMGDFIAQLLFQFCSERYLRGSLLITTSLTFDRWGELLGDPLLDGALVDRLTHHCHIVEFRGQSYRFRQSLGRLPENTMAGLTKEAEQR
jgi:hypothetical protein